MLEQIANRFQTGVLVALVTLLSAVFVLQFGGPQSEGCTSGGSAWAARVDGETISIGEFNSVYRLLGYSRAAPEDQRRERLWEAVLNGIIEAKLLAAEAREVGFHVEDEEIMDRLALEKRVRVSLSASDRIPFHEQEIPVPVADRDDNFDPEAAKNYIRSIRGSVGEFTEWQIEEELAHRMRETIRNTVRVSPQEVWEAYVRERDRAQIAYVQFRPAYYRESLEPTEDELRAWMAEHTEEVDAEYERNRHRYTDLEPQVRSRHILIRSSRDDDEEARAAARERAEGILARARAGEDFADLARENSDDSSNAGRGGDLGYNPRGRMVSEFDDAQFDMEIGDVSEVVETRFGFHVIKVVGKREGDVPEDEAKLELSERLYREARGEELAREAADAALEQLRGGMSPDELQEWLDDPEGEDEAVEDAEEAEDPEEPEVPEPEEPRNPLAPTVEESRPFARTDNPIRGPSDSSALVRDAFARNMEDPLPEEPIQLGNEWVVYQLVDRTEATREEFDGDVQERLRDGLLVAKQREALSVYVRGLREDAENEGRIRISAFELSVEREGAGEVTSSPSAIECGTGDGCTAGFSFGEMVQLRAESETGGRFLGWGGACSGRDPTCIVSMVGAQMVTARFVGAPGSEDEEDESEDEEETADEDEEEETSSEE